MTPMIELILTVIILLAIGAIVWFKDSARSSFNIMVTRRIRKAAQHAADTSLKPVKLYQW